MGDGSKFHRWFVVSPVKASPVRRSNASERFAVLGPLLRRYPRGTTPIFGASPGAQPGTHDERSARLILAACLVEGLFFASSPLSLSAQRGRID